MMAKENRVAKVTAPTVAVAGRILPISPEVETKKDGGWVVVVIGSHIVPFDNTQFVCSPAVVSHWNGKSHNTNVCRFLLLNVFIRWLALWSKSKVVAPTAVVTLCCMLLPWRFLNRLLRRRIMSKSTSVRYSSDCTISSALEYLNCLPKMA